MFQERLDPGSAVRVMTVIEPPPAVKVSVMLEWQATHTWRYWVPSSTMCVTRTEVMLDVC